MSTLSFYVALIWRWSNIPYQYLYMENLSTIRTLCHVAASLSVIIKPHLFGQTCLLQVCTADLYRTGSSGLVAGQHKRLYFTLKTQICNSSFTTVIVLHFIFFCKPRSSFADLYFRHWYYLSHRKLFPNANSSIVFFTDKTVNIFFLAVAIRFSQSFTFCLVDTEKYPNNGWML